MEKCNLLLIFLIVPNSSNAICSLFLSETQTQSLSLFKMKTQRVSWETNLNRKPTKFNYFCRTACVSNRTREEEEVKNNIA